MKNKENKKNNSLRILMIIVLINVIISSVSLTVWLSNRTKTGYVNIGIVYEGFELQKQKKKELESLSYSFKNTLDSIGLQIKYMEETLQSKYDAELARKLEIQKNNFYKLEDNFMTQLEEAQSTSEEQVWQQINDYTKLYGDDHGYDYIFGGNGSGSMMYAKESKDLTDEVLAYINKKYEGE